MPEKLNINSLVTIIAISGIFILSFLVLRPIAIPIIFALLFAYIFHPLYIKIYKALKRPNLSAALLMILLGMIIAVPIVYFTPLLVRQIFNIYVNLQNMDLAAAIQGNFPQLLSEESFVTAIYQVNSAIGKMVTTLMNQFVNILVDIPNLILKFVVFFFTFFFAIKDSDKLGEYMSRLSPFSKTTEKKFLEGFRGITNSIMLGQVLIGVLQGLALGIGLWILGVGNVLTLTFLTMLISIIPILGSWLVWFPVVVVLIINGDTTAGLILFFYSALFVSSIDNFVRPYLLSKSTNMPLGVSLIGTIGGLYFLGILGLILGPLILAYALIILDLYQKGKLNELTRR
ncbi:AI-2E family transporter [archaeon]|jgi:predicted PurR-regulated permease PerM|nr:AI-2E family transporter [archaeon]